MARRTVGLVYTDVMGKLHKHPYGFHIEQPARITSIVEALKSAGVFDRCTRVKARCARDAELESVHKSEHIREIVAISAAASMHAGASSTSRQAKRPRSEDHVTHHRSHDDDIYFNENSSCSARLAAGCVVDISLRVARGQLSAGAAVVRPPGHHAEADKAMGFCIYNNVAIAAHVLVHGRHPDVRVERVLIVDWDVHHGNGTQRMFWKDPNVLYFSIHRRDLYPGGPGNGYEDGNHDKVGEGDGAGFNINVPWLGAGFGDLDYLTVFDDVLIPVARQFKPDLVLVSAGFDSAKGDIGGCQVTPAGYSQMTSKLMDLADGRVVLVLEGGYDLESLSASYLACVKVMLGDPPEEILGDAKHHAFTLGVVSMVKGALQRHWTVLSTEDVNSAANDSIRRLNNNEGTPDSMTEEAASEITGMKEAAGAGSAQSGSPAGEVKRLREDFNSSLFFDLGETSCRLTSDELNRKEGLSRTPCS